MKILAITVRYPGVERVFEEGRKLGLWETLIIDKQKSLTFPKADIYIFGAVHPIYEAIIGSIKRQKIKCKIGYYWTSSTGETDLVFNAEMPQLMTLVDSVKKKEIDFLLFGDRHLAEIFNYPGVYYAPYPIYPVEWEAKEERNGISLLCPQTSKKNILNQLLAVKLFQRERPDEKLYTNLINLKPLIEWLGINAQVMNWLHHKKYVDVISSVKCGLQVSIAESNNYVVVDHFLAGVPCLVSPTIDWAFGLVDDYIAATKVTYTNNPEEIARRLKSSVHFYEELGGHYQKIIIERAERNNKELKELLERL